MPHNHLENSPLNARADRPARSAVSEVVAFVEDGIRAKTFPAGRLPTEAEICEHVGVSRTPVREAIKMLDAMGVVEIRRGIGTFATPSATTSLGYLVMFRTAMSSATPRQLFEARLMVERMAASLAAACRTEADLTAMRNANSAMQALAEADTPDLDAVTDADVAFHDVIFDSCGNPMVGAMGKFVVGLFRPWIKEGHRVAGAMVSIENHQAIIDAIAQSDGGKAQAAAFDRPVHEGLANWQARLENEKPMGADDSTAEEP